MHCASLFYFLLLGKWLHHNLIFQSHSVTNPKYCGDPIKVLNKENRVFGSTWMIPFTFFTGTIFSVDSVCTKGQTISEQNGETRVIHIWERANTASLICVKYIISWTQHSFPGKDFIAELLLQGKLFLPKFFTLSMMYHCNLIVIYIY